MVKKDDPRPSTLTPPHHTPAKPAAAPVVRADIAPLAAPTPPAGYTQTRTLTIAVYTASGKAPMYYLNESPYSAFHGGAENVAVDVRNRLSPPPAPSGSG